MVMKSVFMLAWVILSIPFCSAKDHQDFSGIEASVKMFLQRTMKPKTCETVREAAERPGSNMKKSDVVAFCDSDFDLTKPLLFSEMRLKETDNEKEKYVCGIVSGTTLLGRKIGMRFIADGVWNLVLKVKISKRPIIYLGNNDFLRIVEQQNNAEFNDFYARHCS